MANSDNSKMKKVTDVSDEDGELFNVVADKLKLVHDDINELKKSVAALKNTDDKIVKIMAEALNVYVELLVVSYNKILRYLKEITDKPFCVQDIVDYTANDWEMPDLKKLIKK